VRLTGFPLYSEEGVSDADEATRTWLEAGPAPILFTPGSANVHGREFFAAAAEACARLGRRGLLLTRFPEQIPATLPAGVRHAEFVPFSWLVPRSAALVLRLAKIRDFVRMMSRGAGASSKLSLLPKA
jgi:UDP:flavonoid glycosyltransferase YjiC (YdhE family)